MNNVHHDRAIAKLNSTVLQLKEEDNPNKRVVLRQYLLGLVDAFNVCGAISSLEHEEYLLTVSENLRQDY